MKTQMNRDQVSKLLDMYELKVGNVPKNPRRCLMVCPASGIDHIFPVVRVSRIGAGMFEVEQNVNVEVSK
jgi:hypothetical protein